MRLSYVTTTFSGMTCKIFIISLENGIFKLYFTLTELEEKVKVMRGYKRPIESNAVKKESELKEDQVEGPADEKSKITADPSMDGLKAAVDQKLEKLMQSVTQMEEEGK
jgi:hypothetical protein